MTNVPYQNIRLEQSGGIATLTVDRPKQLNALNEHTLQEMEQALSGVDGDPAVRALIVKGAGDKAFVAGADISAMEKLGPAEAEAFATLGHRVMARLEGLRVPTIAAVNGYALGGGLELALACDLLYASERAKLGLPEVSLGVIPGFGGTQRLTRRVGRARAKELIFTGDPVDAAKAREMGLVLEVLPADKLLEHCRGVAERILLRGPLAVGQAKRIVELGADIELSRANALERQAFALLFGSEDQREGMAAFLAKRAPRFPGR